jgi:hypothetical protein
MRVMRVMAGRKTGGLTLPDRWRVNVVFLVDSMLLTKPLPSLRGPVYICKSKDQIKDKKNIKTVHVACTSSEIK